jgi:hypothetical protein
MKKEVSKKQVLEFEAFSIVELTNGEKVRGGNDDTDKTGIPTLTVTK